MSITSDLAESVNFINQVANLFVATPAGGNGVSGFLFSVIDDEQVHLDSDITDHYVESNVSVQDHIALRPERFTLRGFMGELSDTDSPINPTVETILNKLPIIASMLPQFATQAQQLYNSLISGSANLSDALNQATSLYDMFIQASSPTTKQQSAFTYFYSLWLSRQLITITTPWNVFTNCAIESVRAVQDGETNFISDFTVTFKKIRVVQATSVSALSSIISTLQNAAGRFMDSISSVVSSGLNNSSDVPVTDIFNSPDYISPNAGISYNPSPTDDMVNA